jgi:hypothetical protein
MNAHSKIAFSRRPTDRPVAAEVRAGLAPSGSRAAVKIGMINLVYDMRRFVWLERASAVPG